MTDDELQARAIQATEAWTRSMLEGEFQVTRVTAHAEWDPTLRRHVSVQSLAIWRPFDQLRITVAPDGGVVAFQDRNRYQHAAYQSLHADEILRICRTTGVIGTTAIVTRTGQSGQMLVAEIEDPFPGRPHRVRFTVNPTLRQVAAFETL